MTRVTREFASYADAVDALNAALDLARPPLGVKFVRHREEYDAIDLPEPRVPAYYCALLKLAARGRSFKLSSKHFRCSASAHALGITRAEDDEARAGEYSACGLYRDAATAARAIGGSPSLEDDAYGVVIGPLSAFSADLVPDVAIVVTQPYEAMRLVQGYTFHRPEGAVAHLQGQHGICAESTVAPVLAGQMTFSLLCSGTRYMAKWDDDEVAVSLPADQFAELVDGVLETFRSCESDARKLALRPEAAEKLGELGIEIGLGEAYFLDV